MGPPLTAFWISFPDEADRHFPIGMGVTAWTQEDAWFLLEERGYDFHVRARRVEVKADVRVDELDQYVRRDMGPIVLRGVWYPCLNIGFGAPRV